MRICLILASLLDSLMQEDEAKKGGGVSESIHHQYCHCKIGRLGKAKGALIILFVASLKL